MKSQTPKVRPLVPALRITLPRILRETDSFPLFPLPFCQVEPQEKPKTPKGRAHKRELYTRRFVNITNVAGGKRKVGNLNSSEILPFFCRATGTSWLTEGAQRADEPEPHCVNAVGRGEMV